MDNINDFEDVRRNHTAGGSKSGAGVVPVGATTLDITRRDGSVVNVSLAGDATVQDVLDSINAVDPGNLVASIDPDTNAIRITDNSGTGPLSIASNAFLMHWDWRSAEAGPITVCRYRGILFPSNCRPH